MPSTSKYTGLFQTTLPGGVRLGAAGAAAMGQEISIHAPAWGATAEFDLMDDPKWISIHAPGWGATGMTQETAEAWQFQSTLPRGERQYPAIAKANGIKFQSTLPRGERRLILVLLTRSRKISIHAPAWGAT